MKDFTTLLERYLFDIIGIITPALVAVILYCLIIENCTLKTIINELEEIDYNNPVAIYNNEPEGLVAKFFYNVVEYRKKRLEQTTLTDLEILQGVISAVIYHNYENTGFH